jgi:hypothetical protein
MRTLRPKHDPEKAYPGLDPGCDPVFGKDHAQTKHDPEKSDPVFGKDHAQTKHDPEKWDPVSGKDHAQTKEAFYSMPRRSSLRIAPAALPFRSTPARAASG